MIFKKALIDYFYVLFGTSFARGVALINTIIIARMLGPKAFGVFSIFYVVMILTWQLPQAFSIVFVSYAKNVDSIHEKNDLLKASMVLQFLYLLLLLSVSYPLTYALANYCFQKDDVRGLLLVAMLCGGCLMFLVTMASTFQEEERFLSFASLHACYTVLVFICLFALKLSHIEFSLKTVIVIYSAAAIIIGVTSIALLCRRVGNVFILDKATLRRSFAQGKWIFGVSIVFCLFQRIDVLFLTRYLDFKELGIYSVGAQLVSIVALGMSALAGICLPKASIAVRSKESFSEFVRESFWIIVLIQVGIALFILFAPFIVNVLYGVEYARAASILRILLYGWFFAVVSIPFSFVFYALGDARTRFCLEFWRLISGIFLLYLLIPHYGLMGGAYAVTLSLFLGSITLLGVLRYRLTHSNRDLFLIKSSDTSQAE